MLRRPHAISFDAGYTLIQPVREAPRLVADHLAGLGRQTTEERLHSAWQRAEELFLKDYFAPHALTWTSDRLIEELYHRYYGQLLADLDVDDADLRHARTIIAAYNHPVNWTTFPSVHTTLAEIKRQGYRVGIVSDWVSSLPRILRHLGLLQYLDWVLVSGTIGLSKPSQAFYRLAVQRAGTTADRMIHIGDSYYADVLGARTVGMEAVLVDWRGRSWPQLDVPLIRGIDELLPLLE